MLLFKKERQDQLIQSHLLSIRLDIEKERAQGVNHYSKWLPLPREIDHDVMQCIVEGEGITQSGSQDILFPTNLTATLDFKPLFLAYNRKHDIWRLETQHPLIERFGSSDVQKVDFQEFFLN